MNAMHRLIAGGILAFSALSISTTAMAQSACVNGDVTVIRVSKLKPAGTMAGFEKAVADHAQWYASHGYKNDRMVTAPVLTLDRASGKVLAVKDQIMTFHYKAADVPMDKHDAAWDAYVAEYRANSDIVQEAMACLPK